MPADMKWQPFPGNPGVQMAVLSGDPSKTGDYTIRLKLPDGTKFPPHTHPMTENVTVLSGTLMVGLGNTMAMAKMTALPAGTFVSIPKGLAHYAMAKGVTVLQLSGEGPEGMTMIKPMKM